MVWAREGTVRAAGLSLGILADFSGVICLRSGDGGAVAVVGWLRVSKETLDLPKVCLLGLDKGIG